MDNESVQELIQEAQQSATNEMDASHALKWAAGYSFPLAMINSDYQCLRAAQLDFTTMVKRRLFQLSADRLNSARVAQLRSDNPVKHLMYDLAEGMRVFLPSNFVPNGLTDISPLRESYTKVAPAVNKMLGDLILKRQAFILSYDIAKLYVPKLHLCKAHWTPKKGKESGRPLGDLTYVDGTPLNTEETAVAAAEHYGAISHPLIDDIAAMIMRYFRSQQAEDSTTDWADFVLWKMDLRGAYTLISFRPEDVGLFAMRLTGDLVYLQLVGIFGWTGTPAAFHVVTRAILHELSYALQGPTLMYVDDVLGFCRVSHLEAELAAARSVCTRLLGPDSVADDKTESGRKLDILGYTIDLDTLRVSIARKNFLKAFHGFMSVDLEGRMTLRNAQRLASWSSRYSRICRVMRPFSNFLHRITAGRTSPHATFSLTVEARTAIQCWRSVLCLAHYDVLRFTRTLESYALQPATILAEFDASLEGIGIIWYEISSGTEVAIGVCSMSITELGFQSDSSFQNLSEFLGALVAVIGFKHLPVRGSTLALRGDSITALTWAVTELPRGVIVSNAAMVWTALCIAADVNVSDVTHIAGENNNRCDWLSRRPGSAGRLSDEEVSDIGIGGTTILNLGEDPGVQQILRCCSPSLYGRTDQGFVNFWNDVQQAVNAVLPPPRSKK